jgi:hypothetical protein
LLPQPVQIYLWLLHIAAAAAAAAGLFIVSARAAAAAGIAEHPGHHQLPGLLCLLQRSLMMQLLARFGMQAYLTLLALIDKHSR